MDVFTQNESSKLENSEIARYKLFTELYSSVDGSGISLRERAKLNLDDVTYSYGEIEYVEFQNVRQVYVYSYCKLSFLLFVLSLLSSIFFPLSTFHFSISHITFYFYLLILSSSNVLLHFTNFI